MCTVKAPNEVMVCDSARDRVRKVVTARLGSAVHIETVHGEGTRFACDDPDRAGEFQDSIREALGWTEDADGFEGYGARSSS